MRRALVTIGAFAAAASIAACGSSGAKIPQSNASELIARLQQAQQRGSGGQPDCTGLTTDTIPSLESGVQALPANTSKDIRDTLKEGIDNLRSLVDAKCSSQSTTSTSSSSTTSSPTTTSTSTPTTTTTTTTTTHFTPPPTTTHTTSTSRSTNPSGGAGAPGGGP